VYGGAPMGRQVELLHAGAQIVCGTPGRVLDHIRRGTLRLDRVRIAVLDECDEMLSMGFQKDIEDILDKTPTSRQTLLFSATVPDGIQRLSRRFLRSPEFLKLSADFVGVHEIRHIYYSIPGVNRENELLRILAFEEPKSAIIFCNTREETGRVAEFLRNHGHDAEAISSDLSQSDRERVLGRMRAGGIKFLVATDVAARGIDIENLSHVFNYTFPEAPEVYIHRTGRTGRAGKHGVAVSLIGPTEVGSFYYLKLLYKIKPEERALPSEAEIRSHREGERMLVLRRALEGDPGGDWRALARRLIGAIDGERLVAALLARSYADVEGMPVAPRPAVAAPVWSQPSPAPRTDGDAGEARGDSERGGYDRDRPRDRSRDRDRDRDRPRSFGRNRDRDRGDRPPRRQDRPDRPERPDRPQRRDPPPLRNDPPPAEREFWEVWSEEKAQQAAGDAPSAGGAAPAAPPPPVSPFPISSGDAPSGDAPAGDVARLYLNLGRKDGASERDVRGLISTHVPDASVSDVDVMNTHTYLNVAPGDAERIVRALTGQELSGRQLVCEPAKPRRR
jgi:ATP-dependent RNA helicase DeaD